MLRTLADHIVAVHALFGKVLQPKHSSSYHVQPQSLLGREVHVGPEGGGHLVQGSTSEEEKAENDCSGFFLCQRGQDSRRGRWMG